MSHSLYQVNAFTANGKNGNPAGVVLDADKLSDKQMLLVAKKAGFSETAFVCSSQIATHRLRFFTSVHEVNLCGHATIAAWSLMHEQGLAAGSYSQETLAGPLKISILENGQIFMEQTEAEFYDTIPCSSIAPLLGITEGDFHDQLMPQIVSTGFRDVIVPLKDKAVLSRLQVDLKGIIALSKKYNTGGLHVFSLLSDTESIASTRNFGPIDGIEEEAATGTSNGALLCYLKKYGYLKKQDSYRIEQGEEMDRLSYIYAKFKDNIVWVGGKATTISKSDLRL